MDTAADLIERDIAPLLWPGAEVYISDFANSPDPNFQEISRRFVIAKDWDEYEDMVRKVNLTGMYAEMGPEPWCFNFPGDCTEEFKDWYRSSETIGGVYPYNVHLSNKKWPLIKVL